MTLLTVKRGFLLLVVGALVILGCVWFFTHTPTTPLDVSSSVADSLAFSNTSIFDPELYDFVDAPLVTQIDRNAIVLPPPPTNSGKETRAEIATLLALKAERTEDMLANIYAEMDIMTAVFVGPTIAEHFDETAGSPVADVLAYTWYDLSVLTLSEKNRFDRTRPDTLRRDIEPVIDVPLHPAYPSGHATQSFFLAFVMSEIYPDYTEEFFARASEIAHHREIAGVHYPSDTDAGFQLAQQYYNALKADPTFVILMADAKAKALQQ